VHPAVSIMLVNHSQSQHQVVRLIILDVSTFKLR